MQRLKVGDTAPDFTLLDQQQQPVQLSKLLKQQQVLIYFYPKAMTPGCTVQAAGLRDVQPQLAEKNVAVLGISPDTSARLLKFAERDALNFSLLSDPDHQVADAFGVWGEKKFMGKVYDGIHRISFLIGQDSTVLQVYDQFKTSNHHQVVLQSLA